MILPPDRVQKGPLAGSSANAYVYSDMSQASPPRTLGDLAGSEEFVNIQILDFFALATVFMWDPKKPPAF